MVYLVAFTFGVLLSLIMCCYASMAVLTVKAFRSGKWVQGIAIQGLMAALWLIPAPSFEVLGLVAVLILCFGGFIFFTDRAWKESTFFGSWMCFDLAGECLKAVGLLLVAILQTVADAKG